MHGGSRVGAGRPRTLSQSESKVNLTQRQRQALNAMRAVTGISKSELIRQAVEAFLTNNGFLEPIPTNEGATK
jgi:hypothetical protein